MPPSPEIDTDIDIRPVGPGDVDQLDRLLRVLADHVGALNSHRSTPETLLQDGFGSAPMFSALLAWPPSGDALGACVYLPDYSTWRGRPGVYILDLVVAPDRRGSGLGLELMAAAAQDGRDRWNAEYLILSVARTNDGARRFYERNGFTVDNYVDVMTLEQLDPLLG